MALKPIQLPEVTTGFSNDPLFNNPEPVETGGNAGGGEGETLGGCDTPAGSAPA